MYVCRVPKRLEPGLFNIGGHWRQNGSGLQQGGGGGIGTYRLLTSFFPCNAKVGIPNFVSGPREYIMEGEYVILSMSMVP